MSLQEQKTLHVVLHEGAGAECWPAAERYELMKALLEEGYALTAFSGEELGDHRPLLVVGRFGKGAAEGALSGAKDNAVRIRDVTGRSASEVLQVVAEVRQELAAVRQGAWQPWFPVIDYDRCTNCMQCLSFCLFGVYGVDAEQRIQVQHSEQCKTNCPACSRVCPEAAIIFPKYKASPINGEEVTAVDLEREKMKIDISALLGGDVYQMLRQRSERARSRFSKERDADRALSERQKCLVKLVQAADIPPEVLRSLPSPEEIQRRAEEAKARAQAATGQASPKN